MGQNSGHAPVLARSIPLPIALVDAWAAERAKKSRVNRGSKVELKLCLTSHDFSKARTQALLKHLERWCLKGLRPRRLAADGSLYSLMLASEPGESMDRAIGHLLKRMSSIAKDQGCDLEAVICHRPTGRRWS